MRFQEEGNFPVVIRQAIVAEPKFAKPPAFDVCIEVEDTNGHKDWWRGEVSGTYCKGNMSEKTQAQATMDTLTRVGLPDQDLSQLPTLVGKQTSAYVKGSESEGKTYYNVRGLGDFQADIKPIDPNSLAERIAALFGTAVPAAKPAPVPVATAPAGNPFASLPKKGNPFAK